MRKKRETYAQQAKTSHSQRPMAKENPRLIALEWRLNRERGIEDILSPFWAWRSQRG